MYLLVENASQLKTALEILYKQSRVAFDLEFDRDRYTYGFDLCLLQIGYQDTCLLIDPLSIDDLSPIFDFFENPAIQKLVHCPGEDLRLLHHLGCYPKNIADTEVMAKLLNYDQTSLSKLLEVKCGINLNKKQQQSNWHHRPLKTEQLQYAADDVLHLPKLYDLLFAEVKEKNLDNWVKQEFDWLQTVRYTLEPKTNYLKPGDAKNLSPWHAYVLNEIFLLRDRIAKRKNKPAFMILPEDIVRSIIQPFFNLDNMAQLPGLHPSLRNGHSFLEFQENIEAIYDKADQLKLSKVISREWLSDEEFNKIQERKKQQNFLKEKVFFPIQKVLTTKLGANTSRYILSNAWMSRWLNGEVKWMNLQPEYKRNLIESLSAEHSLPFAEVLAFEMNHYG